MDQPGAVDIFEVYDAKQRVLQNTPAQRLVALGDAAVPQLIDALGDARFTRSVGYSRDFFFSHKVITIGDAALTIIERIAGYRFYRGDSVQGSLSQDKRTDALRESVQDWWKSHVARGAMGGTADETVRSGTSPKTVP